MSTEDQEARQWLFYASEDLAYGKLGQAELPRVAEWSFQQSSEKSLKALWLEIYREVPRTHDVAFLLSKLSETFEVPEEIRDAILELAQISPAVQLIIPRDTDGASRRWRSNDPGLPFAS